MTKQTDLEALAARCEAATGPDRELDAEIAVACRYSRGISGKWFAHMGVGGAVDLPVFTASIDAAMTLVPEGALFDVGHFGDEKPGVFLSCVMPSQGKTQSAEAATPALALCAAALRANGLADDANSVSIVFNRTATGAVLACKVPNPCDDPDQVQPLFAIDANSWASVVARVSAAGGTAREAEAHHAAARLHNGE